LALLFRVEDALAAGDRERWMKTKRISTPSLVASVPMERGAALRCGRIYKALRVMPVRAAEVTARL
jgi:hypothetical protein